MLPTAFNQERDIIEHVKHKLKTRIRKAGQGKHRQLSSSINHEVGGQENRKHKQESHLSYDQISSTKPVFINP